jgi:hypothetical protein
MNKPTPWRLFWSPSERFIDHTESRQAHAVLPFDPTLPFWS